MSKDLTDLDQGGRLWLWRRHEGLTGHRAAAALGMGRNAYWEAEDGRRALEFPVPSIGKPPLPLLLQLARKRSGLGLAGTASRLGITHPTLLKRERAGDGEIRSFWEKRGFTFVRG